MSVLQQAVHNRCQAWADHNQGGEKRANRTSHAGYVCNADLDAVLIDCIPSRPERSSLEATTSQDGRLHSDSGEMGETSEEMEETCEETESRPPATRSHKRSAVVEQGGSKDLSDRKHSAVSRLKRPRVQCDHLAPSAYFHSTALGAITPEHFRNAASDMPDEISYSILSWDSGTNNIDAASPSDTHDDYDFHYRPSIPEASSQFPSIEHLEHEEKLISPSEMWQKPTEPTEDTVWRLDTLLNDARLLETNSPLRHAGDTGNNAAQQILLSRVELIDLQKAAALPNH